MEEILKNIFEELQKQTAEIRLQRKLMETVFHNKDAKNFNAQNIKNNMAPLIASLNKMPGMNQPQAQEILGNLMRIIPGG